MGLDMYLEAEFRLDNWKHTGEEVQKRFASVLENARIDLPEGVREPDYGSITVEAAYWRKVNAVHSWFVREVQDGEDKCQRSYVPVERLEELVSLCEEILAAVVWGEPEEHESVLGGTYTETPVVSYDETLVEALQPQSGFFFGSTDYDSWYFEGLKDTVSQIKPWIEKYKTALAAEDFDGLPTFYYQASW